MKTQNAIVSLGFGFLGAFLFSLVSNHLIPRAFAKRDQVLTASAFNLVDDGGRLRGQIGFSKEGPPGLWLMDEKGTPRVVVGLYPDGSGHIGLQDQSGLMVQLMRSYGPKHSPLLIFKQGGQDMMITGLNPVGNPVPFLMHYDEKRQRKLQFGKYDGP